ncbi:hypothetical protein CHARACLAT_030786 [Characodon lateralis]|uniref:Uncharacterized protein n=1 Tax=Characodon lateralis TaxID=208331 RepID=A0ABU7E576_9TELE|nr:hypothetical protein [Characodon lateralis]
MLRGGKTSQKLTIGELQQIVASQGNQVSITTIGCYLLTDCLFGSHEGKIICWPTDTNVNLWRFLNYWDFNWNCLLWSEETEIDPFCNKPLRWVQHLTKDEYVNGYCIVLSEVVDL